MQAGIDEDMTITVSQNYNTLKLHNNDLEVYTRQDLARKYTE